MYLFCWFNQLVDVSWSIQLNPALFDVGLPGLVLIPRTLSGIMERYSQKLYVDSRKLDGMQLTYDVMLYCFFAFYIILCHVLSINIILFIMIRRKKKEHSAKKQKKHQFQLVQKFPHKSILKGSSFFPAGVNRGGHVAAVTFGLQLLWATSHLLGKPTIYKDRWECLCLSLSFKHGLLEFHANKKTLTKSDHYKVCRSYSLWIQGTFMRRYFRPQILYPKCILVRYLGSIGTYN